MPVVFIATGCSALVCQSFLIHRIFRLTKSRLLPAVLSAIALSGFAGSIAAAVTLLTHNTYAQRSANIVPVTVWLLCSAVADVSIAAVLSVFLWRARRTANQFEGSRLRGPLTKALHQTLECGGVVTAAALSALGVYLHDHVTNISVAIGFILGQSAPPPSRSARSRGTRLTPPARRPHLCRPHLRAHHPVLPLQPRLPRARLRLLRRPALLLRPRRQGQERAPLVELLGPRPQDRRRRHRARGDRRRARRRGRGGPLPGRVGVRVG